MQVLPILQAAAGDFGKDPDCTGSLGIAISEAVEDAATHDDTNYALEVFKSRMFASDHYRS